MSAHRATYAVPALEPERILETLEARLRVEAADAPRRRVVYFDTFDWRIHRDGGVLRLAPARRHAGRAPAHRGAELTWLKLDGSVRHRLPVEIPGAGRGKSGAGETPALPPFARDFPAGAFRRAIAPVIAMRRLMPVVELELGGRALRVLDGREKTVVRLDLEQGTASLPESAAGAEPRPLPAVLRVLPVKGFDKAARRVVRCLETELGLEPAAGTELDRALAAVGRRADDYSSKVSIELDPAMPAAEAAKAIHRSLAETLRRNEAGTRLDLDSEFLHDFRVAVRRTRSALSQIKGVYPAADVARFKAELKWLGGLTGPTRDLDVYLLKMDDYRSELPRAVRRDLGPLEEFLRRRQRREQRRLVRGLDSERYAALLAAWEDFLDQPADLEAAPNAGRPIAEVASERIWKVYRRAIKEGRAIGDATPAEALHQLRIECKKLRYLMEFFSSLYEGKKIGRLIRALKKLQDNLGDFNDYEVQQESLKGFAEEMRRAGAAPAATLMAMGRLVEHLEAGQARERRRFARRFATFARPANRRLARELFARSETAAPRQQG